jgi:hypothetical protein
MGPGGNITTNSKTNFSFNRYKEGGIGASTIANRNAKNRLASFCKTGCSNLVTPIPPTPPCGVIDISSIATDTGESTYILNDDYTITECQILNIPNGTTLQINEGQTLTNMGTIENNGTINNDTGTINNNSTIYNNTGGTIENNGTINNSGTIYTYSDGTTTNNRTIDNTYGTISTADGLSTCGIGAFNNSGTITGGGTINTNCPLTPP